MSSRNVQSKVGFSWPTSGQIISGCFGIFMAIIIVALLLSYLGISPMLPYIEGYGGNQNPFVGISNSGILFANAILSIIGLVVLGVTSLIFIAWVAISNNTFKNYLASTVVAYAAVAGIGKTLDINVSALLMIIVPTVAIVIWRKVQLTELSSSGYRSAGSRWLVVYRDYLFIAVFLSLFAFALRLPSNLYMLHYYAQVAAGFPLVGDDYAGRALLILRLVSGVFAIGLFAFATYSLNRLSEAWVRVFHLSINAAAVIVIFLSLVLRFVPAINQMEQVLRYPLTIGHAAVVQLRALIPWSYLYQVFPDPEGLAHPINLLSFAVSLLTLAIAAYWSFNWATHRDSIQHG